MDTNQQMSNDEIILYFIYKMAMRDAVRQKAYCGAKKWLGEKPQFYEVKNIITNHLDKIFSGYYYSKTQEEYDKGFLKATIEISDCFNKQTPPDTFTFGNAQKLLNMIIKYFYVATFCDSDKKKYFSFCHCPMDNQLLVKVWNKNRDLKLNNLGNKTKFTSSWGKENFGELDKQKTYPKRYRDFQEAIRQINKEENNPISNLEFDYLEW